MKNILYLILFLFPVLGYSQIFVAEFDNIVSGTPSVGTYSMLGVFSDNDGYGQTTDSVNTSGIHYFIDAGGQEYVIVAKSGSSPFTIEVDPINGSGVPELGIGQLTSKTNNQYHMTAAVGDLTRTKILNLNIQAGSTGSGVDSASYANDTLYLFLEGATVAQTKVSPAITTFNLNGTNLELQLANGATSTVDLAAVAGITAPPILGQASEPTSDRFFWKDTDDDTTRVKAPFADQGYKDLAYYDDIMNITTNTYQGKAILDTIPLLDGIDQTRLDSMNLIGITSTPTGWSASTAARDSLYPDAFAIAIHNVDSMIIAYSGILVFPDSVFAKGNYYYQPYAFTKYQNTADSINNMYVFKAIDTNIVELRNGLTIQNDIAYDQYSRSTPLFNTNPPFNSNVILFTKFNEGVTTTGTGVSLWDNPYGNNFNQTVDANRPTNSGTSIVFDDANPDYMTLSNTSFLMEDTAFTIYFVLEITATGAQERFFSITQPNTGYNSNFLFYSQDNGVNRRFTLFAGTTTGNQSMDSPYSYGLTSENTVGYMVRDKSNVLIRVNGATAVNNTSAYEWSYGGSANPHYLGTSPSFINSAEMNIKYVLIYNRGFNESELGQIETFINNL